MPQHAKGNVGHIRHHISGSLKGLHGRGRKGEMRDADGRSSPHCRDMLRSYNRGPADCRQPAAPYQHHMTCPEFSDTLDITKGTRHEQASISIFVSASVCQHQTVARVIVRCSRRGHMRQGMPFILSQCRRPAYRPGVN